MRNLSSFSSRESAYNRLLESKALKGVVMACAIAGYSSTSKADVSDAPFSSPNGSLGASIVNMDATNSYAGVIQFNGSTDYDAYTTSCVGNSCSPLELIDDAACDIDKKINTAGDQMSIAFCQPGSACDGYGFVTTAEMFQNGKLMKFQWDHNILSASNCQFLPSPLDGSSGAIDTVTLTNNGDILVMTNNNGAFTSPSSAPYGKVPVQGITASNLGGAAIWGNHLTVAAENGCNQLGAFDLCDYDIVQHPTDTDAMVVANGKNLNNVLTPDLPNDSDSQGNPSVTSDGTKLSYGSAGYIKLVDLPGTGGSAGAAGSGGAGGASGSGGVGGSAGMGGMAGVAGSAGEAGSGGVGGMAGSAGEAGSGGMAGSAGEAGSGGVGGSAGAEQDAGNECGSIIVEGACDVTCDGLGNVSGTITEDDQLCKVTFQEDCTFEVKVNSEALGDLYGANPPSNYNTFSYDANLRLFETHPGTEMDLNDEGHCFSGYHGDGVFTGIVGTHPVTYYEKGLGGLLTVEEKSGQLELFTDASKKNRIILTNADGSYLDENRTCMNNTVCNDNELGAGQVAYVDELDPLTEQEIPDAGADVFDPFGDAGADADTPDADTPPVNKVTESGDGGGCGVCAAIPGKNPGTPEGVALMIAAALAAVGLRKRKGFIGLESKE